MRCPSPITYWHALIAKSCCISAYKWLQHFEWIWCLNNYQIQVLALFTKLNNFCHFTCFQDVTEISILSALKVRKHHRRLWNDHCLPTQSPKFSNHLRRLKQVPPSISCFGDYRYLKEGGMHLLSLLFNPLLNRSLTSLKLR